VRDSEVHRRTFSNPAPYLNRSPTGLAAGGVWPCDLGPDLSRGFRALKTWFTICVLGTEKIGACIAHTCRLAKYLEAQLVRTELFDICAPVALNIVCFGLKAQDNGELNKTIVLDLHDSGLAAPSTTIIDGKAVIRAAIVNHRTTEADIDVFVELLRISATKLRARGDASPPLSRCRHVG
jgi:aromatic-L-amino-acid/L-tryptophan decarboxylase